MHSHPCAIHCFLAYWMIPLSRETFMKKSRKADSAHAYFQDSQEAPSAYASNISQQHQQVRKSRCQIMSFSVFKKRKNAQPHGLYKNKNLSFSSGDFYDSSLECCFFFQMTMHWVFIKRTHYKVACFYWLPLNTSVLWTWQTLLVVKVFNYQKVCFNINAPK